MTRPPSAVITGRGVLSALGADWASFSAAVRAGHRAALSGAPGATKSDTPMCYALPGGVLTGGKREEPLSTIATQAVRQSLAEASINAGGEPLDGVGLIMNNVLGPSGAVESYLEVLAAKGPRACRPAHFVDTLLSMPASRVGIELKLRGSPAVLGGSSPFELALSWLRHGRERTIVAGAAECLSPKCIWFHRVLAERSGSPRLALAQGAAFVVLDTPEEAERRRAPSLGEVLGAGAASEPQEMAVPWSVDPAGRAFEIAARGALADAELGPEDVSAVALSAGDDASEVGEMDGLGRVFGPRLASLSILRPKRLFGEALGASAGLALLAALAGSEGHRQGATMVSSFEMGGAVTSLVVRAAS
jgi:3-oxoacyl-[acyl-carrier-protein] synthase II